MATLVYPWVHGTLLNHSTTDGSDKTGLARFRTLPRYEVEAALRVILDAHVVVAAQGFVAVDLYDGCFLYDFEARSMHLIDLDEHRPGPFLLTEDRLPGSTSYMAPEEFGRGSTVDERTNVFQLGRALFQLLEGAEGWRGNNRQLEVVKRATSVSREDRYESVAALREDWLGTGQADYS